jgi:hypothetical protein
VLKTERTKYRAAVSLNYLGVNLVLFDAVEESHARHVVTAHHVSVEENSKKSNKSRLKEQSPESFECYSDWFK